nr:DUF192 domain-containing protein [Rhabdothermincola salaria]
MAVVASGCSDGSPDATPLVPADGTNTSTTLVAEPGLVAPVGYTAVTVVVTQPDGSVQEWCLWLADESAERSRGLMNVTDPDLGGKAGMVFTYETDTSNGYWMRDTPLPLTIAYVAADGSVVSTADMEPCPEDAETCPSYPPDGPYRYAVEVPQGRLDDLGIVDGSRVTLGDAC